MNKYKFDILNVLFFILMTPLLALLQSSTWVHNNYLLITPQLWLILGAYIAIHKPSFYAIPMIYFISLIYAPLTSLHYGKILLLLSIIFLIAWTGGKILNLANKKIFVLFCFIYTLIIPLFDQTISTIIFIQHTETYSFFNWLLTSILTGLLSYMLYFIFMSFDQWMEFLKTPKEQRIKEGMHA